MKHLYFLNKDVRPDKPKMPIEPFYAATDREELNGTPLQGFVVALVIELAVIGIIWFSLNAWRLL
jgi:hypothetical protein